MRAATGVRPKLVSHPMISFHAPVSQTLTSLKRQHGSFAMRPLLLPQSYLKRARCFESYAAHALASCDALGSLLLLFSCYIVYCC
jgi:hypothetical protein